MSDIAADLAQLKNSYRKGALSLEQNGEKVTFVSGEEMRRRIADLEAEIAREAGKVPSSGFHYPAYNKGL